MSRRHAVIAAVLLFSLSACAAPYSWQNPDYPKERWARDRAACKEDVAEKVERRYGPEPVFSNRGGVFADTQIRRDFDNYEGARSENRLFEECMRQRGYVKARR